MKTRIKKLADLGSAYLKGISIGIEVFNTILQNETVQENVTNMFTKIEEIAKKKDNEMNAVGKTIDTLEKELKFKPSVKCEHCEYLIGKHEAYPRHTHDSGDITGRCPNCHKETVVG